MKRSYQYKAGDKTVTREYNYIPFRYIVAVGITVFEILAVIIVGSTKRSRSLDNGI